MPDKKISELPAGAEPDGTELIPAVQAGGNVYLTPDQLGRGRSMIPLVTGAEPPVLVSNGNGALILVPWSA